MKCLLACVKEYYTNIYLSKDSFCLLTFTGFEPGSFGQKASFLTIKLLFTKVEHFEISLYYSFITAMCGWVDLYLLALSLKILRYISKE